jgi:toxin ParE1/3/4
MTTLKFAPLAEADIDDIHKFISYDDPDIADRFVRELMGVLGMLAENPAAGKQRPDLDKSLRFFPYRKYCIFYYQSKMARKFLVCCTAPGIQNRFSTKPPFLFQIETVSYKARCGRCKGIHYRDAVVNPALLPAAPSSSPIATYIRRRSL